MDERLKAALEQANYSITLQNQKKNAKLRFENALLYSQNGGTFVISMELVSFVQTLLHVSTEAILIDSRGNPIMIDDLSSFLDKIIQQYHSATNEYMVSIKGLQSSRTTKASVGL